MLELVLADTLEAMRNGTSRCQGGFTLAPALSVLARVKCFDFSLA